MNKGKVIQQLFFESIRQRLPGHISVVHEIADMLELSYDSAYRRLRGDKDLSIEEMKVLSTRFGISVDSLFGNNNADILFQPFKMRSEETGFEDWLRLRISEIAKVKEARTKEVIMVARDLPIFYYFDFPELAAFKIYFWKKMLLHYHEYHEKLFDISDIPVDLLNLGKQMLSAYNTANVIEIWCQETFTRLMQQIEFCRVSGFFANKQVAVTLIEKYEALIRHMQDQTEQGCKFHLGQTVTEDGDENMKIFFNEVLLIDNTVFIQRDGIKKVLMTHNSLDMLTTTNPVFCNQVEKSLHVIMKTGNHISGTSGLECNRFFTPLYEKLEEFKKESYSYRFVL